MFYRLGFKQVTCEQSVSIFLLMPSIVPIEGFNVHSLYCGIMANKSK